MFGLLYFVLSYHRTCARTLSDAQQLVVAYLCLLRLQVANNINVNGCAKFVNDASKQRQ